MSRPEIGLHKKTCIEKNLLLEIDQIFPLSKGGLTKKKTYKHFIGNTIALKVLR